MNPQAAYEERTEKLYESEGLLFEFEAVVLAVRETEEGFVAELDRTAFFPEGGGQAADEGTLNGLAVTHVAIEEGRVWHMTDRALTVGETVRGAVNAQVRFRRMQHHGAEHIISGLIHSLYGIENAGFHMSRDEFTIDTAAPLSEDMVRHVERLANRAVWEDRPIRCEIPAEEVLATMDYRSKTALSGKVRIVEIEGYDRCACCAPHLNTTGQIGSICVKSVIKYKKGVRMWVTAGEDAFEYARALAQNAATVAERYSVRPEEIARAVEEREAAFSEKLGEIHRLRERLLALRLETVEPSEKPICLFEDGCDGGPLRKMVNEGVARTHGLFAVCSDNGKGGYSYAVGIREGDLAPLAANMREALGGRGGGKGTMITGFVEADRDAILQFFATLK